MTCRCGKQFCWLCLMDWSTHPDHFRCTTFDSNQLSNKAEWKDDDGKMSDQQKAELELQQWESSSQLYLHHDQALSNETTQRLKRERNEIESQISIFSLLI